MAAVMGTGQVDGKLTADPAGLGPKDDHPVGEIDRLLDVVGDDQDALGGEHAGVPEVVDFTPKVLGGEHIEGAEGFVHEQHLRFQNEGAGETHPLLHPAGELLGVGTLEAIEADDVDRIKGALPALAPLHMAGGQPQFHVVLHREPGQQREALKHHGQIGVRPRSGSPLLSTAPWLGRIRPDMIRSRVLLPLPLRPSRATTSPGCTVRLTPSSTVNSPLPSGSGKCFETLLTLIRDRGAGS